MILVPQFRGLVKRVEPGELSPEFATLAENCWFENGGVGPMRQPRFVVDLEKTNVKTIYRFGQQLDSETQWWFHWDKVVDVVKGQVAGDTEEATFWTGDGPPRFTTASLGTAGTNYPAVGRLLGLPPPVTAPTVTAVAETSSSTTTVRRKYAYTLVGNVGFMERESQPSPLATIDVVTNQHVALSNLATTSTNGEPVTARRIYRAEAGALIFVAEIGDTGTSFTDSVPSENLVGNGELPSMNWAPPPDDLENLVNLPNGMAAGSSGIDVWLCEPYRPYAWANSYAVDHKIVALAPFAQSVAVLTTGTPYVLSGVDPSAMTTEASKFVQPCVSKRSVWTTGDDVFFAGTDGLCMIGSSAPAIMTADIFTPEQWRSLRPETMVGVVHQGHYIGTYDPGTGRRGFALHLPSRSWTELPSFSATAFFKDRSGKLFCCINDEVHEFRGSSALWTGRWRSKVFRTIDKTFVASRVVAPAYPVTQRVYTDGVLTDTIAVQDSTPFKLPQAQGTTWQIEVEFDRLVQPPLVLADTMDDAYARKT